MFNLNPLLAALGLRQGRRTTAAHPAAGALRLAFKVNVETHRGEVLVRLPVLQAGRSFRLNVVSQGCADAGLCYPPMTRTAQVSLAAFGGDGQVRFLQAGNSPSSSSTPNALQRPMPLASARPHPR